MTTPKLYYTNESVGGLPSNYSQFDVLEKVLCDGWGQLEVTKAEVRDNYLHLEFSDVVPPSMKWYSLVELTARVATIDGYYRCVGVNTNTATFMPVDRIVPDYQGGATGSLTHISAGWTKLFKDTSTLVIRPKGEANRCFLVRQNLHQNGYIASLNSPWRLQELPDNSDTRNQFANNAFIQIAQLNGWDSTLSLADNYTRYVMPIKTNIPGVPTSSSSFVPMVVNSISNNPWYIVATDSYCYFGSRCSYNANITGIGVSPDVYGNRRSFLIGYNWWGVNTNISSSYDYNRKKYGFANVSNYTESGGGTTSIIESPDGKTGLKGLNTTYCYFRADSFTTRFKYVVPKCDPVVLSMVSSSSSSSSSSYFVLPGAYWYNGEIQAVMSINTVDNRDMLCLAIDASYNYNSNNNECSYVGVEL